MLPEKKNNIPDILSGLKEHTLYKVKVAWNKHNPIHVAFLFNGFDTGGYLVIYTNNYDYPISAFDAYYLEIIEELSPIN